MNLNMEMLSIRSVCGFVLAILYRKTLTTQGPCGTITTFDPVLPFLKTKISHFCPQDFL